MVTYQPPEHWQEWADWFGGPAISREGDGVTLLSCTVADQAALAIENARLRDQAQQAAAFAERSRLARELHDSVTQSLYSLTLYAEATARMLEAGESRKAAEQLRELGDTAREALQEMRLLIFELKPLELGRLKQAVFQLEREVRREPVSRVSVPRLINRYFWLIDHYRTVGEQRERVEEVLARVGLEDRMEHKPTELSGGQMQRVAIARALAMDPAILLADEPTGNLDSTSGGDIMALFEDLWRQGRTVVVITHDAALSRRASRVVEIRDGRITRDTGAPAPGGSAREAGPA